MALAGLDVFSVIGDETRRSLLMRLAEEGEKTVSELLVPFAMSQPALSKHLRLLREAGLVSVRQEGRRRFYKAEGQALREVYDWVGHFENYWDEKLDALGRYLDKRKKTKTKKR